MIDFALSEEQRALQNTAREFAQKEVKPLAASIGHDHDLQQHPWLACQKLFARGVDLGLTKPLIPENYGGLGLGCIDAVLLFEELGAADVGIASDYFALTATMPLLLLAGGNTQQRDAYLPGFCNRPTLLAGALSEPSVAGSELFCPAPDPNLGIRSTAKRSGDNYVISGTKSAFITNGGIANWYFVMARTDLTVPVSGGTSIFMVPSWAKGLSFGKKTELIGLKTTHHAELFLDNIEVPEANRIGGEGQAMPIFMQVPQMAICLAACYVGLARAAYEYALSYARDRRSWGQPIFQHQAVALKLADMYAEVQAARLMVWDAALTVNTDPMTASLLKGPAAKTCAVDAAIHNAQRAVEILGGYGVTTEYDAGRYLNDAWVGYSCDFTRDMLRLGMAQSLAS